MGFNRWTILLIVLSLGFQIQVTSQINWLRCFTCDATKNPKLPPELGESNKIGPETEGQESEKNKEGNKEKDNSFKVFLSRVKKVFVPKNSEIKRVERRNTVRGTSPSIIVMPPAPSFSLGAPESPPSAGDHSVGFGGGGCGGAACGGVGLSGC